jgi:hypothetical protein
LQTDWSADGTPDEAEPRFRLTAKGRWALAHEEQDGGDDLVADEVIEVDDDAAA